MTHRTQEAVIVTLHQLLAACNDCFAWLESQPADTTCQSFREDLEGFRYQFQMACDILGSHLVWTPALQESENQLKEREEQLELVVA
jgi:hypothetical protein